MVFNFFLRLFIRFVLIFVGTAKVTGRENIPKSGPYIIVLNHMSLTDAPLLFLAFPPVQLRFFAGEKWQKHPVFGPIMAMAGAIYINRGEVDRKALSEAMMAIEAGSIFALAPEGTRSKVGYMQEARPGAAYLATRSKIPILPAAVVNTDTVGANLKRLRRTKLEAHIGKPFELPNLDRRIRGKELPDYTHFIMAHIAIMLPERYHGYYAGSPAITALRNGEDAWLAIKNAKKQSQKTVDTRQPV